MRFFLTGTLVAIALTLAACGGGGSPASSPDNGEAAKTAQQVLADAVKEAKAASSLHISGQITAQGKQISIDLTSVKGKGATGSLTLNGKNVDLTIIGTDVYMKADASFWTQFAGSNGAAIAQLVAGKWLKASTTNPQFGQLAAITDSASLFNSLTASHGALTNKGKTTYNGQSVVAIYSSGAQSGTLDVAATGTAYPVAFVRTGSNTGAITFDNWNKSVTLTAPSGAVDISQLGG